ncbi:hypothetical protein TrST_g11313 [Triparma strigata]|uniref:Uncharacterized protein n=1 Tax=Triparma strigata TaxID=1606541 RepID=A0A9W7AMJ5_9STRA|nr:hypothetical protein TrST_g11313 [Triparma strigata]
MKVPESLQKFDDSSGGVFKNCSKLVPSDINVSDSNAVVTYLRAQQILSEEEQEENRSKILAEVEHLVHDGTENQARGNNFPRRRPRPRDEGTPDEDVLKDVDKIQMKYQAYSTMALVAALQVGFAITDFAAADVDDLWGFLHAAILSLVIIGNFIGAGVLTLEYFYALRLFVEGRKGDDGVPIYLNFVNGCSGIRQRVSGYITKSMFFYIIAVGLGFAKEQNGAFNWKSITILAIIFSGAVALAYSLVSVHVVLAQASSTKLRSQSSRKVAVNVINPKSRQRGNGNKMFDGTLPELPELGVSPHF